MQSDSVKLYASTLTAVVLVIGGLLLLTFVWMQPIEGKEGMMALLGGFVGMGATFLFQQNASVAGVRNFQAGLNTPAPDTAP